MIHQPGKRPEFRAWIKQQPCLIYSAYCLGMADTGCGTMPDRYTVEPAHVKTWGSSRTDEDNIVPLCPKHHDEQEGQTKAFERKYGLSLKTAARQYWRAYEQEQGVTL